VKPAKTRSGNTTVRKVVEPTRGPVTRETVKKLVSGNLRGSAAIAQKYAKS